MQREKEELQRRIQDKNNKGWIKTPLQEGVFDNVDMDGNVSPYKYNLAWSGMIFKKNTIRISLTNIPPFPSITRRTGNLGKRGTSFVRRKEMTNYSKSMEQK